MNYLSREDREWLLQLMRATIHAIKTVINSSGEWSDDSLINKVFNEYGVTIVEENRE